MRHTFESHTPVARWLAASQMLEESKNTKRPFVHCQVAMRALTGLGSTTLNSIARGKERPSNCVQIDTTKVQVLPKEISDSIIHHIHEHGENSNTSGRVYVPDLIGSERVASKEKLFQHWWDSVAVDFPEGYKVSRSYWTQAIDKAGIDLQRRKPGADFCDECIEMETQIAADPDNRELILKLNNHQATAKAEKDVYRKDFKLAVKQTDDMGIDAYNAILGDILLGRPQPWMTVPIQLHLAVDMGASWHYPRYSKQPKSTYMAKKADVFVFVAVNLGSGHRLAILWDETMGKKDANKTVN